MLSTCTKNWFRCNYLWSGNSGWDLRPTMGTELCQQMMTIVSNMTDQNLSSV